MELLSNRLRNVCKEIDMLFLELSSVMSILRKIYQSNHKKMGSSYHFRDISNFLCQDFECASDSTALYGDAITTNEQVFVSRRPSCTGIEIIGG